MPITIAEYDYVIVDNDAAKPESSPSGACAAPQRASEWSSSADFVE
jgi:hypothetical protein